MANRDVAAARKIGARYLATKKGLNLGSWCRSVSAKEVEQGTHASTVLRDVLTSYESRTFTFRGYQYITVNARDYDIRPISKIRVGSLERLVSKVRSPPSEWGDLSEEVYSILLTTVTSPPARTPRGAPRKCPIGRDQAVAAHRVTTCTTNHII